MSITPTRLAVRQPQLPPSARRAPHRLQHEPQGTLPRTTSSPGFFSGLKPELDNAAPGVPAPKSSGAFGSGTRDAHER
ncbi:MAG: hypothetical protein U0168_25480 [Nannocystaceae bacterium]